MLETKTKLQQLLKSGLNTISLIPEEILSHKISPKKWSKKEILGHLIDSGINNLQCFTEIKFETQPYKLRDYKQDELVIANNYQNIDTKELLQFWLTINNQILHLINLQTETSLSYKIKLKDNKVTDVRFLIIDYVNHMEYHLHQIIEK